MGQRKRFTPEFKGAVVCGSWNRAVTCRQPDLRPQAAAFPVDSTDGVISSGIPSEGSEGKG